VDVEDRWRPRRRKCRKPKFTTEQGALFYATVVRGEPGRTAYECSAHPVRTFHLHPKGQERHS